MSILIKGMDMPQNCAECPCSCSLDDWAEPSICRALREQPEVSDTGRLSECPLVEIPTPHGRLIDEVQVQKIIEDFVRGWCQDTKNDFNKYRDYAGVFVGLIKQAPTIIEAEE